MDRTISRTVKLRGAAIALQNSVFMLSTAPLDVGRGGEDCRANGGSGMTLTAFLDYWCALHWQQNLRHFAQYLLIAFMLILVGPFGTFEEEPLPRLIYWFATLSIFGGAIMPVVCRIIRSTRAFDDFANWSGIFGCILFATIPMTFVVHAIELLAAATSNPNATPTRDSAGLMTLFVQVLAINLFTIGINSLFLLIGNGWQREPKPSFTPGLRFLSRLPDHLGSNLIHLQMEDHYLRATTDQGNALVLIRFRDAMAELADFQGMQVHRSWWVANAAIERFSREGRKLELVMRDGTKVPVSGAHRKLVEDALG
jgi:LytTr DNA-binding domain